MPKESIETPGATRVAFLGAEARTLVLFCSFFGVSRLKIPKAGLPVSYRSIQADGVEVLVTDLAVRFVAPARFDDVLRIHVRCAGLKGARFRFEYAVERDGTPLVDGHTGHACVNAQTLLPTRTPGWLVDAIATAEQP